MNDLEKPQKQYIPWMIVGLMDFVTVIGFDDIIYNFQNQGLVAFTSWIIMTFFYVIPYNLIVAHMGSTFSEHGGGITSWMRETNGDTVGYYAAWFYWITGCLMSWMWPIRLLFLLAGSPTATVTFKPTLVMHGLVFSRPLSL